MKIRIDIETINDSFYDEEKNHDPMPEVRRILNDHLPDIEVGSKKIRDINGNPIGEIIVEE